MAKKPKISTDELSVFQDAVAGTRRHVHDKVSLKAPVATKKIKPDADPHEGFNLDASLDLPDVAGEEALSYKESSISHIMLRKLRKGQYNVDAVLDLHGLTIEQAKTELVSFIRDCWREECRVVLVIHGKGTHGRAPVIKNMANKWLRQMDMVLAFCSAAIAHGGRGAVYVLLKHKIDGEWD